MNAITARFLLRTLAAIVLILAPVVPVSSASAAPGTGPITYVSTASNGDQLSMTFQNPTALSSSGAVLSSVPLLSSNYFSWTATIACCITSRQWTQTNTGAITM